MPNECSCSFTMSECGVVSQYYSSVILLNGVGAKRPTLKYIREGHCVGAACGVARRSAARGRP